MKRRSYDNKMILWLQAIAILLVIWGHSYPREYVFEDITFFRRLLICFQMALFFSISGFLFGSKTDKYRADVSGFLKKKVSNLLVPYLFVSTLSYIIKVPLSDYALRPIGWSWKGYLHGLIYPWDNPNVFLWFIPTLFVVFLLFILLAKVYTFRNHFLNAALFVALAALCYFVSPLHRISTPLNVFGVMKYLFFFYAGMMMAIYQPQISYCFPKKINIIFFCIIALECLLLLQFTREEIYLLTGLAGMAFFWSLSYLLKGVSWKPMEVIGKYTFQLFLFSWFGNQAVIILCWKILGWSENLCIALAFAAGVGIPLLICYLTEKYVRSEKLKMLIGL